MVMNDGFAYTNNRNTSVNMINSGDFLSTLTFIKESLSNSVGVAFCRVIFLAHLSVLISEFLFYTTGLTRVGVPEAVDRLFV